MLLQISTARSSPNFCGASVPVEKTVILLLTSFRPFHLVPSLSSSCALPVSGLGGAFHSHSLCPRGAGLSPRFESGFFSPLSFLHRLLLTSPWECEDPFQLDTAIFLSKNVLVFWRRISPWRALHVSVTALLATPGGLRALQIEFESLF